MNSNNFAETPSPTNTDSSKASNDDSNLHGRVKN